MSLITLTLQPSLQSKLDSMVHFWDKPAEDIIKEALNGHLKQLETQKLDAERAAFEQMHPEIKTRYQGQFVAVHQGKIYDSDMDFEALCLRVQASLGNTPVLIREVHDSLKEKWRIRGTYWEVT